jgi:hypothetical protein
MEIFSHILWVYVLARNKLWRDEAILFAVLPDAGFLFIIGYVLLGTPAQVGFAEAIATMPDALIVLYHSFHSFLILGIVMLIVWRLRPKYLPTLSGWLIHIIIDIPVHDGTFATRIFYPVLPNTYIHGFSWLDYRVLAINYLALLVVYVYCIRRDNKKHRLRKRWKPDWIDKTIGFLEGLINRNTIPASDAERNNNNPPSGEIPGKDGESTKKNQDKPAEPIITQKNG